MKCLGCGHLLTADVIYCPKCGRSRSGSRTWRSFIPNLDYDKYLAPVERFSRDLVRDFQSADKAGRDRARLTVLVISLALLVLIVSGGFARFLAIILIIAGGLLAYNWFIVRKI